VIVAAVDEHIVERGAGDLALERLDILDRSGAAGLLLPCRREIDGDARGFIRQIDAEPIDADAAVDVRLSLPSSDMSTSSPSPVTSISLAVDVLIVKFSTFEKVTSER
jgi:hypothetical protein